MKANQLKEIFTFNIKDFRFYDEIKLYKVKREEVEQTSESLDMVPPVESPEK